MPKDAHPTLSRRERQIMDILFQRSEATGSEILEALPDPPSYSAVRAVLRVLEQKGHVRHQIQGLRYVWKPRIARESVRRSALRHLMHTFFEGSVEQTVAALLEQSDVRLDDRKLARLRELIDEAAERKAAKPKAGKR